MNIEKFALVTNKVALKGNVNILRSAGDYTIEQIDNAQNITIVSAYYGENFVRRILGMTKAKKQKRNLTLIFAALPEVARKEQIIGLKRLEKRIVKLGFSVEIRLANSSKFLHAKLFHFRSEGRLPVYLIGSANLSDAAFNQNDEVLVAIKGSHPGLNGYIRHVLRNSYAICELPEQSAATSWREFLRDAFLYFRPNRSITYTIDPFAEDQFKDVAKRLKEQQLVQALPFADSNGLGLNLVDLLELNASENSKLGFRLPTYSIETDYGYWVPQKYVGFIEEKIKKSADPRRRELERRGKELQKSDKGYVKRRIKIYLDAVEDRLASGVKPLRLSNTQKEAICEKIMRRVSHLTKLLTHPKTLERLARALVGAPVPEFWEDEASVHRFFEGFCYDIVSKLDEPKRPSKIITHLAREFQIEGEDDIDECRTKIEEFFSNGHSWDSDNWPSVSQQSGE